MPLSLVLRNTMSAPAAVCIEVGRLPEAQAVPAGVPTWAPPVAAGAAAGDSQTTIATSDSALSSSSSASTALAAAGALPPVRQYVWCGRTRVSLPAVPPGQLVEVPLRVAAPLPAQLAVTDCLITWHFAGPPRITGSLAAPPHYCTIQQA